MAIDAIEFDTGLSQLPDIGVLQYNGVIFSSLFYSKMSGKPIRDNAERTIRFVEYTLQVVGNVTLADNAQTTDGTVVNLRRRLEASGGELFWTGRGYGEFTVNAVGGKVKDVAWGPVPELFDFQPLGGGLGASVIWKVTTRIYEFQAQQEKGLRTNIKGLQSGQKTGPVLQFNFETGLTYDDENYSQLSLRGTLEIPMTRNAPADNTVNDSVYNYRQNFMQSIINSIDQTRYRITRRNFPISRDRRTMEWEVTADEIPPMGDPPGASNARGRFTVRPAFRGKGGILRGFSQWICSLSITYTIRKDRQRRLAWLAFAYMVWYRMQFSRFGTDLPNKAQFSVANFNQNDLTPVLGSMPRVNFKPAQFSNNPVLFYNDLFKSAKNAIQGQVGNGPQKSRAYLIDFGFDEGMHRDSKTITFEASWMLITLFGNLLVSSGLWRLDPNSVGGNVWRLSMEDVTGWRGHTTNAFDSTQDLIVDFGGG